MKKKVLCSISAAVRSIQELSSPRCVNFIEELALQMKQCFQQGNKILIAGNGGSLCDAAHFAEELTGYFRKKRPALSAIALTDPGHLSCVANDSSYEQVFSRGIEALGKPNDLFIALTTSGNSKNILNAVEQAKKQGLITASFLGRSGGLLLGKADLELVVAGNTSDRIQEAHMTVLHILVEMVEDLLFYNEHQATHSIEEELCNTP